ncbi:hypothetical protein FKM82_001092 [Ascaphus truei]
MLRVMPTTVCVCLKQCGVIVYAVPCVVLSVIVSCVLLLNHAVLCACMVVYCHCVLQSCDCGMLSLHHAVSCCAFYNCQQLTNVF